jgi:ribonuclease HII
MTLQITQEQVTLLLDLKTKADEFARLVSEAHILAKDSRHGVLVMLEAAPRASFEAIKTLIAVRKAFGIYTGTMEDVP